VAAAVAARSRCSAAPSRAASRGRPSEFIEPLCFCLQELAIRFARDVKIVPVFNSIIARFHDVRRPAALVFETKGVLDRLVGRGFFRMDHPVYGPGLAPCDFFLF
jgi:hypothetical protein